MPQGSGTDPALSTPADVLALLASAGMPALPYQDFTGERRRYRAALRQETALRKRDAAARAKAAAEQASAEAERASQQAAEAARLHAEEARLARQRQQSGYADAKGAAREQALGDAEQWSRASALQRASAARHAEALRAAETALRRETLELEHVGGHVPLASSPAEALTAAESPESLTATVWMPSALVTSTSTAALPGQPPAERPAAEAGFAHRPTAAPGVAGPLAVGDPVGAPQAAKEGPLDRPARPAPDPGQEPAEVTSPSWLQEPSSGADRPARGPLREALQHSRERVAARWYALRGLFGAPSPDAEESGLHAEAAPVLAIFSVAGGVGKTSLAATLTRALAALGERVLLVDTTGRGLLPVYLGARELRPEPLRRFAPPAGSTDQPIHLLDAGVAQTDKSPEAHLAERIRQESAGFSRVIVDVISGADETLQALVEMRAHVLVPMVPDMNAVIALPAVRRALGGGPGHGLGSVPAPAPPAYLLVQFEAAQPLQLDVREIFEQQLGERLLPFTIRRSPTVAEALAEGMTVIDYAPGKDAAGDYRQLARWLRGVAEPARAGLAQARWSER